MPVDHGRVSSPPLLLVCVFHSRDYAGNRSMPHLAGSATENLLISIYNLKQADGWSSCSIMMRKGTGRMDVHVLSVDQVRAMLLEVCEAIISSEDVLAQADRDIGDGDHGMGMALGFAAARDALTKGECTDVFALFSTLGMTLISTMGGASGIIFGMMFYGGSKGRKGKPELTTEDFYHLLKDSLAEIQNKGKAELGDKTMVDALYPLVESMGHSVREGHTFKTLLNQASKAAEEGKEQTKFYVAKHGKAKTLGDRAIGFPDAGAVSVSIMAQAMHRWADRVL